MILLLIISSLKINNNNIIDIINYIEWYRIILLIKNGIILIMLLVKNKSQLIQQ